MRTVRIAIPLATAAMLLAAAPAWADKTITATPPSTFTPSTVTMDQGERVTFNNMDTVAHNVVASKRGDDGKPLFATRSDVAAGQSAPVEGAEFLTTGAYEFVCTLHPGMDGTLNVTANGTPAPRPAPPAGTDTRAPALSLAVPAQRLGTVVKKRRLSVRARVDEAGRASVRATTRYKGRTVTVARGSASLAAGSRTLALALTSTGRKALAGAKSARITVSGSAKDAAGNTGKARKASRTLRR